MYSKVKTSVIGLKFTRLVNESVLKKEFTILRTQVLDYFIGLSPGLKSIPCDVHAMTKRKFPWGH